MQFRIKNLTGVIVLEPPKRKRKNNKARLDKPSNQAHRLLQDRFSIDLRLYIEN